MTTETSDRIKQWRIDHNLTQQQAADKSGSDVRSWRRWENKERKIPAMLERLIKAWNRIEDLERHL